MPTTSSTFIYIGNLADIDTDESDTDNENPGVLYQTFTNATMFDTQVDQTDINGDGTVQSDDQGQTPDTFTYDVGAGSVTSGSTTPRAIMRPMLTKTGSPNRQRSVPIKPRMATYS